MIKVFINEEEVVSDKNFNIEEELLSTSSIILNNCYPKSWENDKDYTSKFYYPKDYSKCKIGDGTFENGTKQYTTKSVSGINPSFETNTEMPLKSLTLYGKCEQETTTGNNFLPDVIDKTQKISNGLTLTFLENNKINLKGTTPNKAVYFDMKLKETISLTKDVYVHIRNNARNGNVTIALILNNYQKGWHSLSDINTISKLSDIKSDEFEINKLRLFVNPNQTIDITLQPSLEYTSNITEYEPYTGGEPSPNPDYPQEIKSIKGNITINISSNNEINLTTIDLQGNELCSIADIKDELVIENGNAKIIKRISKIVLNGSENWERYDTTGSYVYTINVSDIKNNSNNITVPNAISNRFIPKTPNDIWQGVLGFTTLKLTKGIRFSYISDETSTVEKWKLWLSNNNTEVYYELETPQEIDLGPISLPNTHLGQNNILVDSNLTTTVDVSYIYKNYDLLFAGVVKNSGEISLNPRYPHYCSLQILDFKTFLSEGETLDFVISNKTINEAIDLVISTIADYGFIKGDISIFGANDIIGAYSTQNKTPYDFFQYIANITGSIWTTTLVDENQVSINFYDPTKLPRGINLEYNTDFFEKNKIRDLSFSYGSRDYRNKQVMESSEVYANVDYNEIILADGVSTTFSTSSKIAVLKNIKVNGVQETFTTKANKDIGIESDFYYSPGSEQIESEGLYTLNTQIEITYTPLVRGRQIVYNYDEVTRIKQQIGRKGIIARYENRNDILSSDELDKVGQSYIRYKGSAEVILTLVVEDNDIYNIGQIVYFDSPIEDLAQDYMIKKKSTKIIATIGKKFYTYELTSSFNSEKAINYFDNQRSKASGNIAEGESITRNIDLESNANIIFYGASASEIEVTNNNILDSILDSPFIE